MKKNCTKFFSCFILFISFGLITSEVEAVSDSLITTATSWKYIDNGSNQGTAWKAPAFNDASWATGNAELGYGDGDEATVISYGNSANNKYITTYFRKSFTVTNASNYSSLTFGIVRDDGAVVYLNGTEVYRTNMPAGSFNFKTKASTDITGTNESTFIYFTIASTSLVSGTNNVSVEIHQFDKTSPDISFKLNLAALQVSCFAPAGLNATSITTASATLNWSTVSGAVGYNIRYRIVGSPSWINTSSVFNSVNISSLTPGANYEWQVQTDCGSANLSAFSSLSSFTTLTPPCNTPSGLNTTNITTTSSTLNWGAVSGAVGYNIQYRIVGAPSWTNTTSATTSVNISSLTSAANYEWQVQTDCGSANLSAFSSLFNFTTLTPPCNIPSGLNTTNITTTSAMLNWSAVNGAVGYNIQYRIIGAPSWTTTTSATNSVNISLLIPASTYEWQAQTNCGSANLSTFSSLFNFTTLTPPCNTPTGLNTTNITTTSATLNWGAVSVAVGYNIQYRIVGAPSWAATTSATNSVNISLLIPASTYEWQVQTNCGSANLSTFSSLSSFITLAPLCNIPTSLSTTNITTTSATLNWSAVNGAVGYNIQYRIVGAPSWTITTSATTSVNISSLTPGANYEWQVQTDCGNSNLSAFSSLSNFTTLPQQFCGLPSGIITHSITNVSGISRWNPVVDAINYNFRYRIVSLSAWTSVSTSSTFIQLSGLTAATAYEWQVQTVCPWGTSAFTASTSFTTLVNTGSDNLISSGGTWKYFASGTSPAAGWTLLSYNDGTWNSGPSQLGYGDGDEATLISYGPNANSKYITTYFRKVINVSSPASYVSLLMDVLRDDGIVVYVNGTEIYRNNMPSGTPSYSTLAVTAIADLDESTWRTIVLSPSILVSGNNVVAAEVHQQSITSSDISFNLRLTGRRIPSVVRGPFLQMLNESSVVVKWKTDVATDTRVRAGAVSSALDKMYYNSSSVTDHQIQLTGLSQSTKYYYTIENGTYFIEGDTTYRFNSGAAPSPTAHTRIWAIGDFGNLSTAQQNVRDAYKNYSGYSETNLWLWLGDNAYESGTDPEFQVNVFGMYKEQFRRMPLFPSPGNHDYANVGYLSVSAQGTNFPYYTIFSMPSAGESGGNPSGTEKYYSFNYSNIHFISLDSYGAQSNGGSAMYNWLQADLDSNQQRWTVVYFHHPPYTKGSHDSDTETELVAIRQNIIPLLESRHVDLVLAGHSHVNERTTLIKGHFGNASSFNSSTMIIRGGSGAQPNPYLKNPPYDGTVYAVCGTGGKISSTVQAGWPMQCMYYSNNTNNASLVIDVTGDVLDCKYLSSSGVVVDQFSIEKANPRADAVAVKQEIPLHIFPNPFSDEINITYTLPENDLVRLEVFNTLGEKVHAFTEAAELQSAGYHEYKLSTSIARLVPGIYVVKMTVKGTTLVEKIIFVK